MPRNPTAPRGFALIVDPASLLLLLVFCRDLAAVDPRALTPEDLEIVRHLELLENLDLAHDLELFVGPPGEAATTPGDDPDDPTPPAPAPRSTP